MNKEGREQHSFGVDRAKGWNSFLPKRSFVSLIVQSPPPYHPQIIRTIDSLQLTATRSLATPANWQKGGSAMVLPTVSAEDAAEKFPEVKQALLLVPRHPRQLK